LPATKADKVWQKLRHNGSQLIQFSRPVSTSPLLYREFGHQVGRDLAAERCDVIHLQHCPQYLSIIRRFNPQAKIILHLHAEMFSQMDYRRLERWFQDMDWLFTVSDYITGQTRRQFPAIADRCETMHDAIDLSEFTREKNYRAANEQRTKRILFAGGVWPHKGPHVLLEALPLIVGRYPDAHLDIVGPDGAFPMEECFDLADDKMIARVKPYFKRDHLGWLKWKSLGIPYPSRYLTHLKSMLAPAIVEKVTFHGFLTRPQLVDFFYNTDVFVFPPIWNEPFGCTPLEAMAAGAPVVASSSGGVLETVRDGQTGFIVDKQDPAALAAKVLELLADETLRESMGGAGRRRAFEMFDWANVAGAMLDRYQRLCGVEPPKIPVSKRELDSLSERVSVQSN
jgi:glycosyltransferase involved in cell wall biosynthesis